MRLILSLVVVFAAFIETFAEAETLRIKYSEKGDSVYGVLSKADPETLVDGRQGIAIVSHGFNGTHHFGETYFRPLNNIGYAVYTFDYPNGSTKSGSGSNTLEMSIKDEISVLEGIVEHFRNEGSIDDRRIVLIGESQGGLVSAMAASELGDKIESLILVYPAFCIPDNWNARYPSITDIPERTDVWGVPLGRRFFEELHDMDPYSEIGKYKNRVLIIHGTDDRIVPLDYSRKAQEVYEDATLEVLEGEGHGFSEKGRELSNEYVVRHLLQKQK